MSITLCAEDCWPSSETKVTSCNSWAFPNLPSIYGMHINLRSVQLLCHCQGYIGHVILIFLYQKQILISQVEIKKSKRGFTPTDRSAHPSILAGEFDKSDESGNLAILVNVTYLGEFGYFCTIYICIIIIYCQQLENLCPVNIYIGIDIFLQRLENIHQLGALW